MRTVALVLTFIGATGLWVAIWHAYDVARRVIRRASVRLARVIGPCPSCSWPVARGHRPDCPHV